MIALVSFTMNDIATLVCVLIAMHCKQLQINSCSAHNIIPNVCVRLGACMHKIAQVFEASQVHVWTLRDGLILKVVFTCVYSYFMLFLPQGCFM